jgi:hypothetical protein
VVLRSQADGACYEMDAKDLAALFKVKIPGKVLSVPGYDIFLQSTSSNRKVEVRGELWPCDDTLL